MSAANFCRGCHGARVHITYAEAEVRRIARLMAGSERNAKRYRDSLADEKAALTQLRADLATHEVACSTFLATPAEVSA